MRREAFVMGGIFDSRKLIAIGTSLTLSLIKKPTEA